MRQFTLSLTLSVGLALVGCAAPVPFTSAPVSTSSQTQPAYGKGDLVLNLQIGDSRTLQAAGNPVAVYNAGDVAKLVITPFVKVNDTFVPMSVTGKPTTEEASDRLLITPTDPHQRRFVLRNLPPNQTYRFQAQAFDADKKLISKDAGSVSEVTFTNHPYEIMANIQLQLLDKPFMATARGTVRFAAGLGSTHHVVIELYKKGTPDVKVGTAVVIDAAEFGSERTLVLGGLAPKTTYLLKAEARAENETVLTSASAEWAVDDDQELTSQILTLSFGAQVSTYAGSTQGDEDGTLTTARFGLPFALAKEQNGDLFVADAMHHRIRRIDAAGNVTTFAGSGQITTAPGTGTGASIGGPMGLAFDSQGNLFVASNVGHAILKITPAGVVSRFAGSGTRGSTDAKGAAATFDSPMGLCVDAQDNLYVADSHNHRIRKITPDGTVTTWAGSTAGFNDANGTSAQFRFPMDLAIDAAQNLYVADSSNQRIRMITPGQVVTTVAGTSTPGTQDGSTSSATLQMPLGVTVAPDGALYVSDLFRIRRISGEQVTTVAGSTQGFQDGAGAQAQFRMLAGSLFLPDGSLLVADRDNFVIRRIVLPPSN